jgi:hypothetical protein
VWDIIAALLRSRGYTHDDEADSRDLYWYGPNLGVRPMLACVAHEINSDAPFEYTTGWDHYDVAIAVPPERQMAAGVRA